MCVCASLCSHASLCVCVCVCVREREREGEGGKNNTRWTETKRRTEIDVGGLGVRGEGTELYASAESPRHLQLIVIAG